MGDRDHNRRPTPRVGRKEPDRDPERGDRWSGWMAAAQEGDVAAYEALLREVRPVLHASMRRRLGDGAAAEDVVQTALLSIHRARHTYRPECRFEPWLWAVALNALRDYRRRGARHSRKEQALRDDSALSAAGAWHARGPGPSPESSALNGDVERALRELPPSQRQAVTLLHVEGLSVVEAADRVGTSPGAFKARVHRAYRTLRSVLQGDSA